MKLSTKIISAAVLMASSTAALAAQTDQASIVIQVTKAPYVVFDATPAASITPTLNAAGTPGAPAQTHSAGDIGLTANITGNCDITVESDNATFNLETTAGVELYPAPYTVSWLGQTFGQGATTANLLCNSTATAMNFNMPAIATQVAAGTYSDTVTITLFTP